MDFHFKTDHRIGATTVATAIFWALAATITLLLASCATPQRVLDIQRGNALLREGNELLGRQAWDAAERSLKAAISAFEGQTSNVDHQRINAYGGLAKAQASTGQCDAAGYSLRSAVNIQIMASELYRDPGFRIQQARAIVDAAPQCTLSTGQTLRTNAENFMRSKMPAFASAELRRAEEEIESKQRRNEEKAQMQALLGATQVVAGQIAADRSRRDATGAAVRAAQQTAEQERQRQATGMLVTPVPTARPTYSPQTRNPDSGNTSSQMHSGSASQIQGGRSAGTSQGGVASSDCRCGPSYVSCLAEQARRAGIRYVISPDGRTITTYDSRGLWSAKKGWEGGSRCAGVVS